MEQVIVGMSESLTCIACRLEFSDNLVMREHYKTDFHRFNLKRKAAGLPSVPQLLFDQKVASSLNPKQNTKGTKHLKNPEKVKKNGISPVVTPTPEPGEVYPVEFEKDEEQIFAEREANAVKLGPEDCLFDSHKSLTLDENMEYMLNNFSFFIPSIDYLTDIVGLLDYLGQKITVGYQCIYCDKDFRTMRGARHHMFEKGHTMMQWENSSEYSEFYKFPESSTTIAQLINENGEIEKSNLAYVEPMTGELILTGKNGTKTLGVRHFSTYYKQKDHRYLSHQLTTSLIQEHKRLAVIEYQRKVNCGVKHSQNSNNRIRKQANMIMHFRDQNGQIL